MPLCVYKMHHRKMLADSLHGERMICVARPLPKVYCAEKNLDEVRLVGGLGVIRVCIDNDDGSSSLILQGLLRVKILEVKHCADKPYPTAIIEPVCSVCSKGAGIKHLTNQVANMAADRVRKISKVPTHLSDFLASMVDPEVLSDIVGYALVDDINSKQHLLETVDVKRRLELLIPLLTQGWV